MNTAPQDHTGELRKARPVSHPAPALPRSVCGHRGWWLLLSGWLWLCIAATSAYAQGPSYGPPKIAYYGEVNTFAWSGEWTPASNEDPDNPVPATYADFYAASSQYSLAVVQGGGVYLIASSGGRTGLASYDSTTNRFLDSTGQLLAVDGDENFLGLDAGITAITDSGVGIGQLIQWGSALSAPRGADYWFQRSGGGSWVAKFVGVPNGTIQIIPTGGDLYCSPPYAYQDGELTLDRTLGDGWPASNLFGGPPSTMYVNGESYGSPVFGRSSSPGTYSETGTYYFSQVSDGKEAVFGRYVGLEDGNQQVSGNVWARRAGVVYLSGMLNPFTLAVSGLQSWGGPAGSISFAAPTGAPSQGPYLISWAGSGLSFMYAASDGSDVYGDSGSGKVAVVHPSGTGGLCPADAYAVSSFPYYNHAWSGSYIRATGAFGPNSPLLAIAENGNLLGTPPGVVAYFASDPTSWGNVLEFSDGSILGPPSYFWKTPLNTWGVKFVNVPLRPFVMETGSDRSKLHRWNASSSADLIIGTSAEGWLATSFHPDLLYVNGVAFAKDAATEQSDTSSYNGSGTATYRSANGQRAVTLSWSLNPWISNWTGLVTYADSSGDGFEGTGTWDGGNGFILSFTDPAIVISLYPVPTAPRHGPGQIAWDSAILTFDPIASFMTGGDDVYVDTTGTVRAQVSASGTVHLSNSTTGVTADGTYNPVTRRFDFGPFFTGVVQALNVGEQLLGDTIITGSLDVHGSTFNFATDQTHLNKPAFAWLHGSGPIVPGAPVGNHLRWLTATSLYEWTWEAPYAPGYYSPLMALRSHPFPTLALSVPITNPSGAQIVIGPYNDTSWSTSVAPSGWRGSGVFVIAAGTKTGNVITPRNALRVLADGTVLIQPGGDISMGEFSAGPQP